MQNWNSNSYAPAIADFSGGNNPKSKFLFKVKFEFNPQAIQIIKSLTPLIDDDAFSSKLSYNIMKIDLPKIEFDYEDINLYNFKTRILRKTTYSPLSFTFYDDVGNKSINFFNAYLQLMMPINRKEENAKTLPEDSGFSFASATKYSALDSSYRSTFKDSMKDPLAKLTIEQFYMDYSKAGTEVVRLNRYIFTAPRITSFDIAEQDHENGGTPNTVSGRFDFDGIFIETGLAGADSVIAKLEGEGRDILSGGSSLSMGPFAPSSAPGQPGTMPPGGRGTAQSMNDGSPILSLLGIPSPNAVARAPSIVTNRSTSDGGIGGTLLAAAQRVQIPGIAAGLSLANSSVGSVISNVLTPYEGAAKQAVLQSTRNGITSALGKNSAFASPLLGAATYVAGSIYDNTSKQVQGYISRQATDFVSDNSASSNAPAIVAYGKSDPTSF